MSCRVEGVEALGEKKRSGKKRPALGGCRKGQRQRGAAVEPDRCHVHQSNVQTDAAQTETKDGSGREVDLSCTCQPRLGRPSRRTAAVGLSFGIPLFGSEVTVVEETKTTLRPGRIVLLTGSSGTGKSSALAQIDRHFAGACKVDRVSFPPAAAVVDHIAPWASLSEAVGFMTCCGFSEPHLWVRRFQELSDGEKFRARLARAVALQARTNSAAPLLCDEFCTGLHRRAAKAISFNLRKLVARRRLSLVLASCHDDVISDLQPHVVIRLLGYGRCRVDEPKVHLNRPISFHRRLRIETGRKRDYEAFAGMHYRATDELGFVDKVFVMRDGRAGDLLGIVVYAHSPLELALRNKATDGRFSRNPHLLNRCFRILRRLVIHPDVRGCGLGRRLVAETLPKVGTPYVECLAAMGAFNPVFERAGMQRVGQYAPSAKRLAALEKLRALGVDPSTRDFPLLVARRPNVRAIVAGVVFAWYSATTAGGDVRVQRQSPQFLAQTFRGLVGAQPVYYLWHKKRRTGTSRAA